MAKLAAPSVVRSPDNAAALFAVLSGQALGHLSAAGGGGGWRRAVCGRSTAGRRPGRHARSATRGTGARRGRLAVAIRQSASPGHAARSRGRRPGHGRRQGRHRRGRFSARQGGARAGPRGCIAGGRSGSGRWRWSRDRSIAAGRARDLRGGGTDPRGRRHSTVCADRRHRRDPAGSSLAARADRIVWISRRRGHRGPGHTHAGARARLAFERHGVAGRGRGRHR